MIELAGSAFAALGSLRTTEGWLLASSPTGRFASLFGRDALISALQALPVDPTIADATLARLGRELGTHDDPETEEEPGRVLHEARDERLDAYVAHGWPVRGGRLRYYGSVDANAWFLIVLGALARHGHDVRAHREAAGAVAGWLAGRPQPITYRRRALTGGLEHQGWRDAAWDRPASGHGVVGERGAPLRPPVALAAVQALAWRALGEAAAVVDRSWVDAAARARDAFFATFLTDGGGRPEPAFALDAGGLDHSATSDLGQVLWTGILDGHAAARAAWARLAAPDLCSPFGLRTLSAGHVGFRPGGYHTGAVWPWDTWVGAAGLDTVEPGSGDAPRAGVLRAIATLGGFPELYGVGTDGTLEPSPESCTLQAWTAGAVVAIGARWDGRAWAPG